MVAVELPIRKIVLIVLRKLSRRKHYVTFVEKFSILSVFTDTNVGIEKYK